MPPALRWALAYIALLTALLAVGVTLVSEAASKPAWDGTFQCRPGETYTTAECK